MYQGWKINKEIKEKLENYLRNSIRWPSISGTTQVTPDQPITSSPTQSLELQRTLYKGLGALPEENRVINSTTQANNTTNTYRDENTSIIFQETVLQSSTIMSLFLNEWMGGLSRLSKNSSLKQGILTAKREALNMPWMAYNSQTLGHHD